MDQDHICNLMVSIIATIAGDHGIEFQYGKPNTTVIDFSSGPRPVKIDSDQWLLPNFFDRIYINIIILKFSGQ